MVSASAGNISGSTTVIFENPARAELLVALDQPVNNLGALSFKVASDTAVTFNNFSAVKPANSLALTNPAVPPATTGVSQVAAALLAPSGSDINAGSTLFEFNFDVITGVPGFTVTPVSVALASGSPVTPAPGFSVSARYYDSAGRVLSP